MPKVPEQLKNNLASIINTCNENLLKLKTYEEVNKYLMELAKAANKYFKADAGLGTVHLKIDVDKILDRNFAKAQAYTRRLEEGINKDPATKWGGLGGSTVSRKYKVGLSSAVLEPRYC